MKRAPIHLAIFILIQAILAYFLKDAFWNPSAFVYTFGGDGAFIYFNMIFHTFFGSGFELSNMNYPFFESILMTDAQGSLALFFSMINDLFPNYLTPEKVIGLSHRFHYIMIGVAGIFIYKSLRLFEVKNIIAIPSAIFITLLSPMMLRLAAGHFGLAYPFVFAYVFFFLIQYFHKKQFNLWSYLGLLVVILFFGLNNFYIGMINLTVILLVSGFYLSQKSSHMKALYLITSSIALVVVLYGFIHFTDPGFDRIEIQWGYYSNSVDISSFIYPPTGILNRFLSLFGHMKTYGIETWINLGIIPLISFILLPMFLWYRNQRLKQLSTSPQIFKAFIFSGFILLLYASAIFYRIPFFRDHFFHEFGILTMFKASARFAWPIYFMSALIAAYYLQRAMDMIKMKSIASVIVTLLMLVWGTETYLYLDKNVFTQMYQNPYRQDVKDEILADLEENYIDINDYQALYSVPVMEGWNDKFHIVPHFNSEYNSILLSMSTGLPMINAMHSRIGVTNAWKAIQLSSNPLVDKEFVKDLQKDKPLLLLYGKGTENLSEGEQFLIRNSQILFDQESYQLRSFALSSFKNQSLKDSLLHDVNLSRDAVLALDSSYFIHEPFDTESTDFYFAGSGSKMISKDREIFSHEIPSTSVGEHEISLWVKLDNRMYGMPSFELILQDKDGQQLSSQRFNTYKSKDIQESWARANLIFNLPENTKKLFLKAWDVNQEFFIDEVLIRKSSSNIVSVNLDDKEVLYNNYKWDLE